MPQRPEQDPSEERPAQPGADLARAALARAVAATAAAGAASVEQQRRRESGDARARRAASRRSTARPGDSPDPIALGDLLAGYVEARGWDRPLAVASVAARWDELVGADLAGRCSPESLTDGVLTVTAESTAWATQLRLLSQTMIERIREHLGDDVVRSIRVHGPTAPSWRRGALHVRGRGPRDTYG